MEKPRSKYAQFLIDIAPGMAGILTAFALFVLVQTPPGNESLRSYLVSAINILKYGPARLVFVIAIAFLLADHTIIPSIRGYLARRKKSRKGTD